MRDFVYLAICDAAQHQIVGRTKEIVIREMTNYIATELELKNVVILEGEFKDDSCVVAIKDHDADFFVCKIDVIEV